MHALGAAVRLDDGRLAAAPIGDVDAHSAAYQRALRERMPLTFEATGDARRPHLVLAQGHADESIAPSAAPIVLTDEAFEDRMAAYLQSTEEWAPPDKAQPFERHLIRKDRRAQSFRGEA